MKRNWHYRTIRKPRKRPLWQGPPTALEHALMCIHLDAVLASRPSLATLFARPMAKVDGRFVVFPVRHSRGRLDQCCGEIAKL